MPETPASSVSGRLPRLYDLLPPDLFAFPCYHEPRLWRPARYGFQGDSALINGHAVRVRLQAHTSSLHVPTGPALPICAGRHAGGSNDDGVRVLEDEPLTAAQAVVGLQSASLVFWGSREAVAVHCRFSYPKWSTDEQRFCVLNDAPTELILQRPGQQALRVQGRGADAQLLL